VTDNISLPPPLDLFFSTQSPSKEPFVPRVFQSRVDGTVAVEWPCYYQIAWAGPAAKRMKLGPGRVIMMEFVRDNLALDFVELAPKVDPETQCTLPHYEEGL
jgi:hypothetical protein